MQRQSTIQGRGHCCKIWRKLLPHNQQPHSSSTKPWGETENKYTINFDHTPIHEQQIKAPKKINHFATCIPTTI